MTREVDPTRPTTEERRDVAPTRSTHTSPSSSLPQSQAPLSVQSSAVERHVSRTTTNNTKNPGKRKRSRFQMTITPARESMEDREAFTSTIAKRSRPMAAATSASPRLGESTNQVASDDDDDGGIRFSVPPAPPSEPVPSELVCRYPNKPCPQARATKKHGELHSYCAYHRFKAQQYQRKLEQKKRERRLCQSPSLSASKSSGSIGNEALLLQGLALDSGGRAAPYSSSPRRKSPPPHARRQSGRSRAKSSPAIHSGFRDPTSSVLCSQEAPDSTTLEPFHHPVTLQEGDLQLLQVFLMDSESPPKTESTTSRSWDPRTGRRGPQPNPGAGAAGSRTEGRGRGAYSVDLDGFTFTSESL